MKLALLDDWYSSLKRHAGGLPARGTIAGALAVTQALKTNFDLKLDAHTTEGGSQVKGASGPVVQKILARLGEDRKFLKEGGRTNRGLRGEISGFLTALKKLRLDGMSEEIRLQALGEVDIYLLGQVRRYFDRARIKFVYSPDRTTTHVIEDILAAAKRGKKEGAVAQHLVGAKLQLRFPKISITNEPVSAADEQTGRLGDFTIKRMVFHVTVAPMPAVYEKCMENLAIGKRAFLLVPRRSVEGAIHNASVCADGRIDVDAIESFVGKNVDEIAEYGEPELFRLLTLYNERVKEAETDTSLLIEIPKNLVGA